MAGQVFAGVVVYLHPELQGEERGRVREVLEGGGGRLVTAIGRDVTHVVAPHGLKPEAYKWESSASGGGVLWHVSPSWVLESSSAGKVADADGYVVQISSIFKNLVFAPSQYLETERSLIKAHVLAHGGRYQTYVCQRTTHLIIRRPTGKKYEFSLTRGGALNAVRREWLDRCVAAGKIVPLGDDECRGPAVRDAQTIDSPDAVRHNEPGDDGQGTAVPAAGAGADEHATPTARADCVPESHADQSRSAARPKPFCGLKFALGNFKANAVYTQADLVEMVRALGGEMVGSAAECSHFVAQFAEGPEYGTAMAASNQRPGSAITFVSPSWLLAVHDETPSAFIPPERSLLFKPIPSRHGLPELHGKLVTVTRISGRERLDVREMLGFLGATFVGELSRTETAYLLCDTFVEDSPKCKAAEDWGIPILSVRWLHAMFRKWAFVDPAPYRLSADQQMLATPLRQTQESVDRETAPCDDTIPVPGNHAPPTAEAVAPAAGPATAAAAAAADDDDGSEALLEDGPTMERAPGLSADTPVVDLNEATQPVSGPFDDEDEGDEDGDKDGDAAKDDDNRTTSLEPRLQHPTLPVPSEKDDGGVDDDDEDEAMLRDGMLDISRQSASLGDGNTPTASRASKGGDDDDGDPTEALPASRRSSAKGGAATERAATAADRDADEDDAMDVDEEPTPAKKPAGKKSAAGAKRGKRKVQEEAEADKKAPAKRAKKKTKAAAVAEDEEEDAEKAPASKKAKKTPAGEDADAMDIDQDESEAKKQKKATKGTKRKAAEAPDEGEAAPKAKGAKGKAKSKSKETVDEYVFLLGGDLKEGKWSTALRKLGGRVCAEYDDACTHVVLPELRRTEKYLFACATGKYVLKPSFLEASLKQGRFVDEDPHEWSGSGMVNQGRIWLGSCRKWRQHREETGEGAFAGVTVLVHKTDPLPRAMITEVVAAGGGEIVAVDKALTDEAIAGAKYAVVAEDAKAPKNSPLARVIAKGVPAVKAVYVLDMLSAKVTPALDDFRVKVK